MSRIHIFEPSNMRCGECGSGDIRILFGSRGHVAVMECRLCRRLEFSAVSEIKDYGDEFDWGALVRLRGASERGRA